MGAKRKVDHKLYNKITRELKSPKDDEKVMKKYHLSKSTVSKIRKSSDYEDYITPASKKKITLNSSSRRLELTAADRAVIIATWIFILGMVFAAYLFIKWLIIKIF